MKFLHCADLHLDSPLRGLDRYEGAPVEDARDATRRAFENLVSLALRERVDVVVIAGDLYDGDWPDFNTGLFFVKGVSQLAEAGIRVFAVRGNHDAASRITRSLPLPHKVVFFSDRRPESVRVEDLGLAVHGQSFAAAAVSENLAAGYPAAVPGLFNLGVLHTSLTGRPGHDSYAPTTEQVLRAKGYQYWALGHVHAREIVSREPMIVYPGNTQGRHARERGPKGCELVTVEHDDISAESVALDVLRWGQLTIDISGLPDLDALFDQALAGVRSELTCAEGRVLALRVSIEGTGALHRELAARPDTVTNQLRAVTLEGSGGMAWLEKVELRARPMLDLDELAQRDDPIGLLVHELRAMTSSNDNLAALGREALQELQQKLPAELREGTDALRLDASEVLRELLSDAQGELLARLAGEAGAP